jgi:transcriptional regulator with XRE-family HTH domain
MPHHRFSQALHHERERTGLSQHDVAERCGMRREAVARLERGEREPRLTTVVRLARALDMTPAELVAEAAGE